MEYGDFNFTGREYNYPQAILAVENFVSKLLCNKDITSVFIEDIQLRRNIDSFKKLAHLQGVLVNLFEKNKYLYGIVSPSQWQSYCSARGRNPKEIKANLSTLNREGKKTSKALSIQFVKDKFDVKTDNDNIADAISMGWYVVNNIVIEGVK